MEATHSRPRTSPKRILLVEDDPIVAHMIRMALTVDGHTVDLAEDGEEGIAVFEASQHDLVITDFMLGGLDGLELAEEVKRQAPAKPVILITAYTEKLGDGSGQVSNIDLLLKKPVSVAELHKALATFFPPP